MEQCLHSRHLASHRKWNLRHARNHIQIGWKHWTLIASLDTGCSHRLVWACGRFGIWLYATTIGWGEGLPRIHLPAAKVSCIDDGCSTSSAAWFHGEQLHNLWEIRFVRLRRRPHGPGTEDPRCWSLDGNHDCPQLLPQNWDIHTRCAWLGQGPVDHVHVPDRIIRRPLPHARSQRVIDSFRCEQMGWTVGWLRLELGRSLYSHLQSILRLCRPEQRELCPERSQRSSTNTEIRRTDRVDHSLWLCTC